jgi:hypothetical protein
MQTSSFIPRREDAGRASHHCRPRLSLIGAAGLTALLMLGCQRDEIQTYDVPKPEATAGPARGPQGPVHMLAAIVPHGQSTWFFKLTGPVPEMETQKDAFDQFIRSVRFTDQAGEPVTWTVPAGWRQEKGSAMRYATLRPGEKAPASELTVVVLPGEAGSMLANINRWRDQIGLPPTSEAELGTMTRQAKINDNSVTFVDLTGPGVKGGKRTPPFASARPPMLPEAPSRPGLKYTTPPGWKELPATGGLRAAAFQAGTAEVTIVPLGGPAGGLLQNVIRWREQIGLGPVDAEQLRREVRSMEVDGAPASYVDLVGPDSAGGQRILAVSTEHGGQTWFIKMKGPSDVVAREKAAFEAFVRSLRFGRG